MDDVQTTTSDEHIELGQQNIIAMFHKSNGIDERIVHGLLANYHATMAVYSRIDAMLKLYGQ